MIFFFVVFYWHVFTIIFLGRFQLAIFACTWFFAMDRNNLVEPLENAFEWIIRYHFGSVALCAFLLPLVTPFQLPVSYLKSLYEKLPSNIITNCLGKIFNCFEDIFLFVNKFGLVKIALDGSSYLNASSEATKIVKRNILRYGALDDLVDIVLLFVNFLIGGIIVYGFDLYLNNSRYEQSSKFETHSIIIVNFF